MFSRDVIFFSELFDPQLVELQMQNTLLTI